MIYNTAYYAVRENNLNQTEMLCECAQVEAAGTLTAVTCSHATGCPVYVVHVTSKAAARVMAAGKQERKLVFGEAVTAGIAGDGNMYFDRCWEHAAAHVLTPPMRTDADFNDFIISLVAKCAHTHTLISDRMCFEISTSIVILMLFPYVLYNVIYSYCTINYCSN